jgi:hypothetical protein
VGPPRDNFEIERWYSTSHGEIPIPLKSFTKKSKSAPSCFSEGSAIPDPVYPRRCLLIGLPALKVMSLA